MHVNGESWFNVFYTWSSESVMDVMNLDACNRSIPLSSHSIRLEQLFLLLESGFSETTNKREVLLGLCSNFLVLHTMKIFKKIEKRRQRWMLIHISIESQNLMRARLDGSEEYEKLDSAVA